MSISLRTKYLGLDLKNPVVASAGPHTGRIDSLMKLEEAGASAVVLPSLFEEQISREEVEIAMLYDFQNEGFAEAQSYLPEMEDYHGSSARPSSRSRSPSSAASTAPPTAAGSITAS